MPSIQAPTPDATAVSRGNPADILNQLAAWQVLIPDRNDVDNYLTRFPDVGDVLPVMSAEIRRSLGPTVELSLEVYHDPEIVDEYLSLYVRKESYERGFIQEIDVIRRKFDDALERTTGFLQLTTDYRRPRAKHAV